MENHSSVPVWHKNPTVFHQRSSHVQSGCDVTYQYGLLDFMTEVKLSWIHFLKCLGLTDLGQYSKINVQK